MDLNILIPVALFASIAFAIKATVDAYTRRRIIEARGSEELVRSLLEGEAARQRRGSLLWGSVLLALGLGFGLLELFGVRDATPGAIALLLGATGLGNLAYYMLERRSK